MPYLSDVVGRRDEGDILAEERLQGGPGHGARCVWEPHVVQRGTCAGVGRKEAGGQVSKGFAPNQGLCR